MCVYVFVRMHMQISLFVPAYKHLTILPEHVCMCLCVLMVVDLVMKAGIHV